VLGMAEFHFRAVEQILDETPGGEVGQSTRRAATFFEESLAPYEISYRGYRSAMELNRRVTHFAYSAVHEIKAPLTSILSSATMLEELLQAGPQSLEGVLMQTILNGIRILKAHTDDMMDVASLYAGAFRIRPQRVNLRDFLERVVRQLKPEVEAQNLQLAARLAPTLTEAELDSGRVQQVLTNLVQNAVKYAPDGGAIELAASMGRGQLTLEVRDHGRGLSKPQQAALLGQVWPLGRNPEVRGTGLGLILCRQIVEAHGGRLLLHSQPRHGSTFEIRLPLRQVNGQKE
jgi:signal transduction histidine kinase